MINIFRTKSIFFAQNQMKRLKERVKDIQNERFIPIEDQKFKGGTHGSVIICTDSQTKTKIALKYILNEDESGIATHALKEIAAYKTLGKHANILHFIDVFNTDEMFLCFEAMPQTLREAIVYHKETVLKNKNSFQLQLANAIAHCHSKGIMHRDLKPQNILVNGLCLKLCDFGLAKQISKNNKRSHTLQAVTLWYKPIEILLGFEFYNEKIDIWGMACVFFEMEFGCAMFSGDSEVAVIMKIYRRLGNISDPQLINKFKFHNKDINFKISKRQEIPNLWKKMLDYNYDNRPSAANVVNELSTIEIN